ncbi:hypothetical protein H257_16679 [Aphanomyces astaci]|uniref:Uncharacterized protein n=1 Tax=Aphanomyces astaci TaxID=112090 RepID=W4FJH3_APHAT|nr:hypothetical protein H257_16679 [Aphanomyces astaci]ETV66989.1 hypothetical protein H257_16679 [Aphanomyces astaci]|eukprot:XP_009843506.1 hypothetical protein H257_16679 [Aphanomyces astaci]
MTHSSSFADTKPARTWQRGRQLKPHLWRASTWALPQDLPLDADIIRSDGSSTMVESDSDNTVAPQTAPFERKLFSGRKKLNKAARGKEKSPSHAESLLKGLESVGSGLQSLGTAVTAAHLVPDNAINNKIISSLEVQTAAINRQSGQLERLLEFLINRG